MMDERLKRYEPFFGEWHISDMIGKGAFGEVYEIYRDDGRGSKARSALKFVHIPSEEALKNQIDIQPNMEAVRNFFAGQLERVKDEVRILQKCRGHSNIVGMEDYLIVENPGREGVGWDILIRMELLRPIVGSSGYFADPQKTQMDVIRLWMNMTSALIYCEQPGVDIIHRDIKPTNIMVSDSGIFKLSDFGAARKNLQGQDASTRIGTEQYMAPEVYKGRKYDKRADYYSLGVVIYYFLNGSRRPFMPPYYEQMDHNQMIMADEKRIYGKNRIPEIPYVSRQVNRILLKSLAYKPQDRYKSAEELYRDLEKLAASQGRDLAQKPLNSPREGRQASSIPVGWMIVAAGILLTGGAAGLFGGICLKNRSPENRNTMTLPIQEQPLTTEPETIEPETIAPETGPGQEEQTTETSREITTHGKKYFAVLERPAEGEKADRYLGVAGMILTSREAGDPEAEDLPLFVDIIKDTEVLKSIRLTSLEKKEADQPAKDAQKYISEIEAASVYEITGDKIPVDDLPDGDYSLVLRTGGEDGTEDVIAKVEFTKGNKAMSREEQMAHDANYLTQADQEAGYIYHSDLGYTIGMDQNDHSIIQANASQIVLTGWINASDSTGVGMILKIDGNEHTFGDIIGNVGGSAELIRTSRYLESLTDEQRGGPAQNDETGGWILHLSIPSLPEGEHEIRLIFNVALQDQKFIDMSPLKVFIDNSIPVEEGKTERIAQEWKNHMKEEKEGWAEASEL